MIPVYFCSVPTQSAVRGLLTEACESRWYEHGVNVRTLTPRRQKCQPREFQRERRRFADWATADEFYVVADDDCLVPAEPFIEMAVDILERHPEFAVLSLFPKPHKINPWQKSGCDDLEVMEHVDVGGVRFCRKGCLKEWPPMPEDGPPAYDRIHAEALRAAGWRCGYYKELSMLHLGSGVSTVWP